MSAVDFEKMLKEINEDDLKVMFGTTVTNVILRDKDKAIKELEEYQAYKVPVTLGTIFKVGNLEFKVCCLYTDKSVDICNIDGTRENVGLYGYKDQIEIVGALETETVNI